MGTSYFFKNNNAKMIIQTDLFDITKNLLVAIHNYGWNMYDEIDIIDDSVNIQDLVEKEGFIIDYKFW